MVLLFLFFFSFECSFFSLINKEIEIEIEEAEETGPLSMSLEEETGVPDGLTATTVKTDVTIHFF